MLSKLEKRILESVNSPNTSFLTSLTDAIFYEYIPVNSFSYHREQILLHKYNKNVERNVMQINIRFNVSDCEAINKGNTSVSF